MAVFSAEQLQYLRKALDAIRALSGRTVLNGSGAPGSGVGANGDFYIDTTADAIYGPKTGGAWGSGVSLIGPAGTNGTNGTDGKTVLNGSGAPGSGVGANGDFYIDTAASNIYGPKAGGAWGSGTSLVGAAGAPGAPGPSVRTGVVRNQWIPAGAMQARTTSGATSASTETSTNKVNYDYFDFTNASITYVQFGWAMPDEWNRGTIKVKFYWLPATGSGNIQWGIQAQALSDGDAMDSAWGTAQVILDTVGSTGNVHCTSATPALTVGGSPALGDVIQFQIYRDTTNNTLAATARLLGVAIQYTESSTEPSAW